MLQPRDGGGAGTRAKQHHLNVNWKTIMKDNRYFLLPPATARTPIRLESKSPLGLGSPFTFTRRP
jgi:hypothetical protein